MKKFESFASEAFEKAYHCEKNLGAFCGPEGTRIYLWAPTAEAVFLHFYPGGYYVQINHGDGYRSIYLHMTHYVVSVGQNVTQGQVIGYCGSTGASTGPHLHFGISYNGNYVNPANYISI